MDVHFDMRRLAPLAVLLLVPLVPLSCQVNRQGVEATRTTVSSVLEYPPSMPKARQYQYGFEEPPEGDWTDLPESITDVGPTSSGYELFASRCFSCHRIQPSQLKNVDGLQWGPVMTRHNNYSGVQVTAEMARKIQFYLMWRTARNESELARIVDEYRIDQRGNDLARGLPPRQHDRYFWNIETDVEDPEVPPAEVEPESLETDEEELGELDGVDGVSESSGDGESDGGDETEADSGEAGADGTADESGEAAGDSPDS